MRWTRKTIIVEIQRLHKAGTELNYAAAESNYLNLVRAAAWHFGTWRRAVEQAGIDYESLSKYQRWDRRRIIARIRELHADKADLSWRSVSTEVDPPLAAAALRPNGFASWRDAIAAAGLNIEQVARYRNWSSEQVLREIKALHRAKKPLSSKAVQTSNQPLFCAARRRFGSWDAALSEAGLNVGKIRLRQPADRRLELGLVPTEEAGARAHRRAKALLNGHSGNNGRLDVAVNGDDNATAGKRSRSKAASDSPRTQLSLPLAPTKTGGRKAAGAAKSAAAAKTNATAQPAAAKPAAKAAKAPQRAISRGTATSGGAASSGGAATSGKATGKTAGKTAVTRTATKAATPAMPKKAAGAKTTAAKATAVKATTAKATTAKATPPKATAGKATSAKPASTKAAATKAAATKTSTAKTAIGAKSTRAKAPQSATLTRGRKPAAR